MNEFELFCALQVIRLFVVRKAIALLILDLESITKVGSGSFFACIY